MKRQIATLPLIGLLVAILFIGVAGGAVFGGSLGYWLAQRDEPAATETTQATKTSASPTTTTAAPVQSDTSSETLDQIVARVNPAVVTIENRRSSPTAGEQVAGMGSGFIIDEDGHIVTNNHVVEGADALTVVYSDGTRVDATLVGADAYQDVAVIKVDGPVPATVEFGDSSTLNPGQSVIAIGSALGEFRNTVTNGIVGGLDRSLDTGAGYRLQNLVQHDAPINPGNSGGPLLNEQGQVVGMNTAVVNGGFGQAGAEGLGFAVEGNTVRQYAETLIANGKIDHPYLGVTFRPVSSGQMNPGGNADAQPVMVMQVESGSPADHAGLQSGDVITAIDGVALDGEHPFLNQMFEHSAGDSVTLTVERSNGGSTELSVTLGSRPAE